MKIFFSFGPALIVVSKILKFSEYIAGVTILALGNGIADIITSLTKEDDDTELMINELLGNLEF